MKIKVKPEGRKDAYIPDKQSLISWLSRSGIKEAHHFFAGSMLIGAKWDIESVIELVENGEVVAILIHDAKKHNLGHALAVVSDNKLNIVDIGDITEDDLNIQEL